MRTDDLIVMISKSSREEISSKVAERNIQLKGKYKKAFQGVSMRTELAGKREKPSANYIVCESQC